MRPATVIWIMFLITPGPAATPGVFVGTLIQAQEEEERAGWMYVEGRNRSLRRVNVRTAAVVYGSQVGEADRQSDPARSLRTGAEVRITAQQDRAGEWRASRVEILRVAPATRGQRERAASRPH